MDNVVWEGAVLDPSMDEVNAPGIISALKMMGEDPRLDGTVIQTVGSKGWDGFALAWCAVARSGVPVGPGSVPGGENAKCA